MNVKADSLAKSHNQIPKTNEDLELLELENEIGPLRISSGQDYHKISSAFRSEMYEAITTSATEEYWLRKMKIDPSHKPTIDWEHMGKAFNEISKEKQKELVKWNSEFCGTSKNLKRWKEQNHQKCPVCGFDGENTKHILTCPHPEAKTAWTKTISTLRKGLLQQSTSPEATEMIIENLNAWRENKPARNYNGPARDLREAIEHQASIGWEPFIRGFVSNRWRQMQKKHLEKLKSKKSNRRWVSSLIIKLWQISWDMWRFRNGILHSQSTTNTTNFTFLLTTEILKEYDHGNLLLPPVCDYLFNKPKNTLLNSTINNKKLWLSNVWAARDTYTPADIITQTRHQVVLAYVTA